AECRANVHRGMYRTSGEASQRYEAARAKIARFIGADVEEIVFTRGATESLNLAAMALGQMLKPGDEIVVTEMEHHANLVPWQQLAARTGATLRWFGVTDDGRLDLSNLDELVNERTKVVAFAHQSNVLGTVNPLGKLVEGAQNVG